MKYYEKEYDIKICDVDYKFKFEKIKPTLMLSLYDLYTHEIKDLVKYYNTIFENVKIKIGDVWQPLKEEGRDIYYPANIEDDGRAFVVISNTFIDEVAKNFFQR